MPRESELREKETRFYQCQLCGQTILARLPKQLGGAFAHVRCATIGDDKVLDSNLIFDFKERSDMSVRVPQF